MMVRMVVALAVRTRNSTSAPRHLPPQDHLSSEEDEAMPIALTTPRGYLKGCQVARARDWYGAHRKDSKEPARGAATSGPQLTNSLLGRA